MTAPALDLLALLDPANRSDPYPVYDRLRAAGPRPLGVLPGIVVSSYDDCAATLRDPAMSSDRRKSPIFRARVASGDVPAAVLERMDRQPMFVFLDAPDHPRLRRLVSKAFTARVVEQLRTRVERLVRKLLDGAAERGRLEVVGDLAYPLPIRVISELLGVPVEDADRIRAWSMVVAQALDPFLAMSGAPAEGLAGRIATVGLMEDYLAALIEERRAHPRADLVSALVQVEETGDRLSGAELLSTCMLLVVAGHETTVNLIGNGALALLHHPEVRAALAVDPALGSAVVEETLRYDPPVQLSMRNALEARQYGDVTVPQGGLVLLLLAAAGRDPAAFAAPDTFDPSRADQRSLAFGLGPHFCLGAPLARLEGQVALAELARRVRNPRLPEAPLAYRPNVNLRGLVELPLAYDGITA